MASGLPERRPREGPAGRRARPEPQHPCSGEGHAQLLLNKPLIQSTSGPSRASKRAGAEGTARIEGNTERAMEDRIVIHPEIQHGKPVIRGRRVPVARIVEGLAGGMTNAEIAQEEFHPLPNP